MTRPFQSARHRRSIGALLALLAVYGLGAFTWADGAAAQSKPARKKPATGRSFRDCKECPVMIAVAPGSFIMGSPPKEPQRRKDEGPPHEVTIAGPFAVGKYAVTFAEWDACVAGGGCGGYRPDDRGWGRGTRPVINVSWSDAKAYTDWLSHKTGKAYRLLTEAEREYVTRAGTTTPFWFGKAITLTDANYDAASTKAPYKGLQSNLHYDQTLPVEMFKPNPFGLHQVHGNVWEWVEDCWHDDYTDAPIDGSAWTSGQCSYRVIRGGCWSVGAEEVRSASRGFDSPKQRDAYTGFRVAR